MCMLCDLQCVLCFPYFKFCRGTIFLGFDVLIRLNTNLLELRQPLTNVARKRNTEESG